MLVVLVIPHVALAAWWNPFSWGIFISNKVPKTQVQQVQGATTTQATSTTTVTTTTPKVKVKSEDKDILIDALKKQVADLTQKVNQPKVEKPKQPIVSAPPANSTLCNGVYYSSCAIGNGLVCPGGGGKAYCQPISPISQQVPQQTQAQSKNNTALNEVVATLSRIAATMDKDSATMKEYQQKVLAETAKFNSECGSYTGACYQSYIEIVKYYGDGYQSLLKEWNKLDNEYKQYDMVRLQILGQQ